MKEKLIDLPQAHAAVFNAADAEEVGLPVVHADTAGEQWKLIWRLWAKYYALASYVAEGRYASQVSNPAQYV